MTEILGTLLALLRLPPGKLREILIYLGQPVIAVFLLLLAYASQNIIRERSVYTGLMIAFFASDSQLRETRLIAEAAQLQAELVLEARISHIVQDRLVRLLDVFPPPARVRVSVLHDGIISLAGNSKPRADVSYVVAKLGRATGGMSVNLPISSLASFSEEMFSGTCIVRDVKSLVETPGKEHLKSFGAAHFVSCPIRYESRLLGVLTMYWDNGDLLPTQQEETEILVLLRQEAELLSYNMAQRKIE